MVGLVILTGFIIRSELMQERLGLVRTAVEAAHSITESYYRRYKDGEFDEDTAKEMAKNAIRALRYEGAENYIFVENFDGFVVVNGVRPEREGRNSMELVDSNGKFFVRELIQVARSGGGAVDYWYPRPGSDDPEPKVSWTEAMGPWQWAIVSGVYVSDIDAVAIRNALKMAWLAGIILVIAAGAAYVIIRGIVGPLRSLNETMKLLAGGNLGVDIPDTNRQDELGEMVETVRVFKNNAVEVDRLHAEQSTLARRNERRVRGEMLALTNALDEQVRSAIAKVLTQSDTMHKAANEMASAVKESASGAGAAASASRDASASVDAVAAAAEQLSSSIAEISSQVANAATVAQKAVSEAESTNQQVAGLARAASEIGDVVNLISDIAKQTNLLALNATIEAARAGEAGKGFAVVANEVKTLANQTANATEDIARQIGDMQSATDRAVGAIKGISTVIAQLSEITTAISGAVEEQNAATGEISQNAQQAAHSTQDTSENINRVSSSSEVADLQARHVREAAEGVRGLIRQMQTDLDGIVSATKADGGRNNVLRTVNLAVTIERSDGRKVSCLLNDIASSGVAILDRSLGGQGGEEFVMTLPDVGTLSGTVVTCTESSTHVRLDVPDSLISTLDAFINRRQR